MRGGKEKALKNQKFERFLVQKEKLDTSRENLYSSQIKQFFSQEETNGISFYK